MSREAIDMERLIVIAQDISDHQQGLDKLIDILERMDKRLSHMEDWLGQVDSEIKRITRRP